MSEIAQVIHTFQSNFAATNNGGRFIFRMSEPICRIISARINAVTISNFAAISSSPWYYLRSDAISNTRDCNRFNGFPNLILLTIPNIQSGAVGDPITFSNLNSDFIPCLEHEIHELWFELVNNLGQVINPADVGWMFVVSVEYKINKSK